MCDSVAIIIDGKVLATGTVDDVRGEGSLEEKFIELAGGVTTVEGLEWLHSFSD
jgi:ABC-2 type transport system ATP-binding protein